jgi:hypothetical protein
MGALHVGHDDDFGSFRDAGFRDPDFGSGEGNAACSGDGDRR